MQKYTTGNYSSICLPGQRICLSDSNIIAGQGTYEKQGYIYATLAGIVTARDIDKSKYIEVHCVSVPTMVPLTGDVVTACVLQVNPRLAKCALLCIGDNALKREYKAVLRRDDVQATDKDRVDMYKSFRAGDIILARVLPQTEVNFYQLSTAENELGVVIATASERSTTGVPMIPLSWSEMQCPITLVKEARKVAKIVPEKAITDKNS